MDALASLLTRERLLLELLVFKLVELRQLLLAGETRFLGWAAEEVERAASAVRATELERAVVVQGIATDRGLADDVTLSVLVADAPEPWQTLLRETQAALRTSAREVADLMGSTRALAAAGDRALSETLRRLSPAQPAQEPDLVLYGPAATYSTRPPAPRVQHHL